MILYLIYCLNLKVLVVRGGGVGMREQIDQTAIAGLVKQLKANPNNVDAMRNLYNAAGTESAEIGQRLALKGNGKKFESKEYLAALAKTAMLIEFEMQPKADTFYEPHHCRQRL